MSYEYLAGFFDGEGTAAIITIRREMKTGIFYRFRPIICIAQKNPEVLFEIQSFLGYGYVDVPSNGRAPSFNINGNVGIEAFVHEVSPHSIIKKEALENLLSLIEIMKNHDTSYPYNRDEVLKMIEIRDKSFELNSITRKNLKQKYPGETILNEMRFWSIHEFRKYREQMKLKGLKGYFKSYNDEKNARNMSIKCACGCGGDLLKYDRRGRTRRYIHGHNNNGGVDINGKRAQSN